MNRLSLKLLVEGMIDELHVQGDIKTAEYLVANRGNVWLFPSEDVSTVEFDGNHFDSIYDVIDWAEEDSSWIIGKITSDKLLYLMSTGGSMVLDPQTSLNLKKIVNQLKLKGVSRSAAGGEEEIDTKKSKMKGKVIDLGYHGTCSKYLRDILRTGLRPNEAPSNYPQVITHEQLVFFSSRIDEAMYHATYTADKALGGKRQSIPIIIELTIPDKAKLVPDFDVAAKFGSSRNIDQDEYDKLQKEKEPNQMSRETGIWGYKGRIPASFIKAVYVPKDWPSIAGTDHIHFMKTTDFKKMKPQAALRYVDKLEEYGY
jgi:hypothetical protein